MLKLVVVRVLLFVLIVLSIIIRTSDAFVVPFSVSSIRQQQQNQQQSTTTTTTSRTQQQQQSTTTTSLYAIGVLAKKAKLASLREIITKNGIDSETQHYIDRIQQAKSQYNDSSSLITIPKGPLRDALIRRKGTLTIIAEYKRKLANSNTISSVYNDPTILSATFREFGASAVAVMTDERMGGCTLDDLATVVEEQRRATNDVPGSIYVINNDLIVDEYQIAQTAKYNAAAAVVQYNVIQDKLQDLIIAAVACNIELIVAVTNAIEAQAAINAGARLLSVIHVDTIEERVAVIENLIYPTENNKGDDPVCLICNIGPRNNNNLQEIEEAWAVRDKGYHCVWVGEALYKVIGTSLADQSTEHPGAIIQSMRSKSSLKWASPKAKSGRGEGAREYLGDILI